MSLDSAARLGSAVESLSVREARRLRETQRPSPAQMQAVGEASDSAPKADDPQVMPRGAIERAMEDVDAAFARLQEGTYGICQGRTRPSPLEQLEILPYVRCCVPCQQRAG
ncbi:molecular chaperone DnaK [Streptomyces sp. NPDC052023]|uniref:molecular chaperone DnaK n=1 Tax=Streptomyces sp. NPDC052023 TaxID=3365681 RepID=UPI0037CCEC33